MTTRKPRRRRLTEKEWDAIEAALHYVLAGEDPWEDQAPDDADSDLWNACKTALAKL